MAAERSRFACPRCGEHQLAIIEFPIQRATGFEPANEVVGMAEPVVVSPPAIGCLACGAEWPDLEAFRADGAGVPEPGAEPEGLQP